ncbi:adenosine receptor A2a-like [Stylophora pistillata]|uniref:adenosine receptor A2a-like n=1 Tax=Stylophora pistillata TaxID=50429 RepID=UPI000C0425FB|nr:adenosine receptor A2a-like [Stylophora pistillata]
MFADLEVVSGRCTLTYMNGAFFIAVNFLLSVVGSVGNILVCLTVLLTPNLRVVSSFCIVNLAQADLMVTMVAQPLAISIFVGKLDGTCYVRAEYAARFIGNLSCAVSVLTLATMSFERCFVILKPMKYKATITPRFLKSILGFNWLLAWIVPFLDAFVEDKLVYIYFILIGMTVLYSVVIVCYSVIFITVRKRNVLRQRELQDHQAASGGEKDKKLAITIALVIGFFTICWASFGFHVATNPQKNYGVSYIATVTASFANSAINPIIYFYRNRGYRDALRKILCTRCRRNVVTPLAPLQNISGNSTPANMKRVVLSEVICNRCI